MALISHVIGDCPKCGGSQSFGIINVYGSYVSKGCGKCTHKEKIDLPSLKKKVFYLDQSFFSHAFKDVHPEYVAASKRIAQLTFNQQLAVPFSSIHDDETHMWIHYEQAMEFIKKTSLGHQFKPAYEIEREQLQDALHNWLTGEAVPINKDDAFEENIHVWDGYFRFDVKGYERDRDTLRSAKNAASEGLLDTLDKWRSSTNTIDQDRELELKVAAKNYIASYVTYFQRMRSGDYNAEYDAPLNSMVVQSMMAQFPNEMSHHDKLDNIVKFFSSEQFKAAPKQDIQSRMFAQQKSLVKQGQLSNPKVARKKLSGFFYDVEHISTYAPYCDAIFVDKAMHELVGRAYVDLEERYGVKVFSSANWGEMLAWFDEIEAGMSDEHRKALSIAYPK